MIGGRMNSPIPRLIIAALLELLLLVSCNNNREQDNFRTVSKGTISATNPVTSTRKRVSTTTQTLAPTSIQISQESSVTQTRMQTPSLTPLPPLSQAEQEMLVTDLLHKKDNCKLPCWWGIIPDETSWELVRDKIIGLGLSIYTYSSSNGGIFGTGFYIKDHSFSVGPIIYTDEGRIRVIEVESETTPRPTEIIYGDPYYMKEMEQYNPSNILSTYDEPDKVLVYVTDIKDPVIGDYFILLIYEKLGIIVQYWGRSEDKNSMVQLCPNKAAISMWLWSPNGGLSWENAFSHTANSSAEDQQRFLSQFLPLEAASRMSVDEFFVKFKSKESCLETPANLWGRK
jgi:hypothetical protein